MNKLNSATQKKIEHVRELADSSCEPITLNEDVDPMIDFFKRIAADPKKGHVAVFIFNDDAEDTKSEAA